MENGINKMDGITKQFIDSLVCGFVIPLTDCIVYTIAVRNDTHRQICVFRLRKWNKLMSIYSRLNEFLRRSGVNRHSKFIPRFLCVQ